MLSKEDCASSSHFHDQSDPSESVIQESEEEESLSSIGDDDSSSWEGDGSESDYSIACVLSDDNSDDYSEDESDDASDDAREYLRPRTRSAKPVYRFRSEETDESDLSSIGDEDSSWEGDYSESDDSIVPTPSDDDMDCIRTRTANKIGTAPSPKTDANQGIAQLVCPSPSSANKIESAQSPKTDASQATTCPNDEKSQSDKSSINDDWFSDGEDSETHALVNRKPPARSPRSSSQNNRKKAGNGQKKRRGQREHHHHREAYVEKFKRLRKGIDTSSHPERELTLPEPPKDATVVTIKEMLKDPNIKRIGDFVPSKLKLGCHKSIRKILSDSETATKIVEILDKANALFHPDGHFVDELGDHRRTYSHCIYFEPSTKKIGMTCNFDNRFRGREEQKDEVRILVWDGIIGGDVDGALNNIVNGLVEKIIDNEKEDIPQDLHFIFQLFLEGADGLGFRKQLFWALIEMACQEVFNATGNVGEQFTCDEETNQKRRKHVKDAATELGELLKDYVGKKTVTVSSWPSGVGEDYASSEIIAIEHMCGERNNWSDLIEEPPVPHGECTQYGDMFAFHKYSHDTLQKYVDKNLPKIAEYMKHDQTVFVDRNRSTFGTWLVEIFFPLILKCEIIAIYNGGEFFVFKNIEHKSVAIVYSPLCIANHSAGFVRVENKINRYLALGVLRDLRCILKGDDPSWETPNKPDTVCALNGSEVSHSAFHQNPMTVAAVGKQMILKIDDFVDVNALTHNKLARREGTPAVSTRARRPKEQRSYFTEETRTIESFIMSCALNRLSMASKDNVQKILQDVDDLFKSDQKATSTVLKRWEYLRDDSGSIVTKGSTLETEINKFLKSIRKNKGNTAPRRKHKTEAINNAMEMLFKDHTTKETYAWVPKTSNACNIPDDDPRYPKNSDERPVHREITYGTIVERLKDRPKKNSKTVKRAARVVKFIGGSVHCVPRSTNPSYPDFHKVYCDYKKKVYK